MPHETCCSMKPTRARWSEGPTAKDGLPPVCVLDSHPAIIYKLLGSRAPKKVHPKRGSGTCDTPRLNAQSSENLIVDEIPANILTESNIRDLAKLLDEEMDRVAHEQRERKVKLEVGAREMSKYLKTSKLTETRAFAHSFVKEIEVKPGKAAIVYPTPVDSAIGGADTTEVALKGRVRSSVW